MTDANVFKAKAFDGRTTRDAFNSKRFDKKTAHDDFGIKSFNERSLSTGTVSIRLENGHSLVDLWTEYVGDGIDAESSHCRRMLFVDKAPEDWNTPRRFAWMPTVEPCASVLECGGSPPRCPPFGSGEAIPDNDSRIHRCNLQLGIIHRIGEWASQRFLKPMVTQSGFDTGDAATIDCHLAQHWNELELTDEPK